MFYWHSQMKLTRMNFLSSGDTYIKFRNSSLAHAQCSPTGLHFQHPQINVPFIEMKEGKYKIAITKEKWLI